MLDVGAWLFGAKPLVAEPLGVNFAAHQLFYRLAFADQGKLVPAHEDFGGERTRIVVRGHDKTVSARAHDREQIALANFRHLAVKRKEVAAFTHRADDVDLLAVGAFRFSDRDDFVITMVKRRPNQIVHAGINHREFFSTGPFDVAYARN